MQPYFRDEILDPSGSGEFQVKIDLENKKVKTNKQKTAFPPNYIHSLDSTHLMMTAEKMRDLGLTFASVHDSYWTHAADVDSLSWILRE